MMPLDSYRLNKQLTVVDGPNLEQTGTCVLLRESRIESRQRRSFDDDHGLSAMSSWSTNAGSAIS
jgi:hypothetical protein